MTAVELFPDWRDMLVELERAGVEYLVVGAFALSTYGYTRATKDIDLFVRPSPENAHRVVTALTRFGAPLHGVTADDLARPGLILQLGVAPRRIDVITDIDGVDFDAAARELVVVEIAGLRVPVIGRAALVANKRAAGRPQDLVDARALAALARGDAGARPAAKKRKTAPTKRAKKKKKTAPTRRPAASPSTKKGGR